MTDRSSASGADRTPGDSVDSPLLSIVVPFFNETHRLASSLPRIVDLAGGRTEVLLVDDGSTDGTGAALVAAAEGRRGVQVVALPTNQGKGAALRAGVARTVGAQVLFMDADLATDLDEIPRLCAALEHADVAIGTRADEAADIREATARRTWMGGMFNRAVRVATGLPIRDTQCGFKAFRGDHARWLFERSTIDGFAIDVEILVLATRSGFDVVEVPVRWTEVRGSKVRLLLDPLAMLRDVVRIRRRVRRTLRARPADGAHRVVAR